jgi:lysophospholipase L1-like esterase
MKTILSTFDKDTVKIAVTKGTVRLFGVSFELNRPGVIYNSIGTNGLRVDHFRGMNMEQWKRQLALYNPKLVIINLGTNESGLRISMARYKDGLINLIRPVKDALPESSCLLISPIDRAQKNEIGRLDTHPMIPKLVSAQKEVAEKEGCGFINLYEAMGGRGAMARWMRSHPKLGGGDLTHPTAAGAETLARLIFNGMMSKYDEYLSGR